MLSKKGKQDYANLWFLLFVIFIIIIIIIIIDTYIAQYPLIAQSAVQ